MDATEANNMIRQLLKSPAHLIQATTYIDKQITVKGFLLGLGVIATDEGNFEYKERLISFKFFISHCPTRISYTKSHGCSRSQIYCNRTLDLSQTQEQ